MAYDDENPFEGYDPGGLTPQELLARLVAIQRRLRATISLVERNEVGTRERQAQFIVELDQIKASVLDIIDDVDGLDAKYAELKITADEILVSVTHYIERIGAAEARISVQAGEINSKVSLMDYNGNTIASLINQTALSVTIAANKINLLGITEVASTLYVGGNWRDGEEKIIQFRGGSGGVSIGSPTQDTLRLSAISGITMDSWVYFTRSVDFSGATVTGLTVPYANNAGTVGGLSSNAFPHLPPHQYGASVSFAGNGDMTWIVNGSAFTYRRI